jgi:hypothetical protein
MCLDLGQRDCEIRVSGSTPVPVRGWFVWQDGVDCEEHVMN